MREHEASLGRAQKDADWEAGFEGQLQAGLQRDKIVADAEATLKRMNPGPAAAELQQKIEAIRSVPRGALTGADLKAFTEDFYPKLTQGVSGERSFRAGEARENRLQGSADSPKILSASKHGGTIVIDKNTGQGRFVPIAGMPDLEKPQGVDDRLWAAARKLAYERVIGSIGIIDRALTEQELQQIQSMTWQLYQADAGQAGAAPGGGEQVDILGLATEIKSLLGKP
jgi:hypothetical protein